MRLQLFALAALPFALGSKCIDYDAALAPDQAPTDARGGAALAACADPTEAHIYIQSHAFVNHCGCLEADGKICTVAPGTTVLWKFLDSDEHTVTSISATFGMSPSLLTGEFSHTFSSEGTFEYFCSNHRASMSAYKIVVGESAAAQPAPPATVGGAPARCH